MTAELITVVIPTHNRVGYLREAVASVMAQRLPPASVLIVNDASSDSTGEWLETLRNPLIRSWRLEPGQGGSAARNIGLGHVETPLVLFLDDDDLLRPDALATLAAAMTANPTAAGAAGAFARFGASSGPVRNLHPRVRLNRPVWRELLFGWNMPPSALLWRTSVVRELRGWDEALRRCEDRDINLRAYPRPFALVPNLVMDYRVHPAQVPGADHAHVNRVVLARFVESLRGPDRRVGEAILAVREDFDAAVERYRQGDYASAIPVFRRAITGGTTFLSSPVLGPWMVALFLKASGMRRLPPGWGPAAQGLARRLTSRGHGA
ncbi:MAG TPA: glycosyltransferase family 2 protein [Acidimicrobiales bacterium]|jgi:glycosyltransferase involved in cell wall biosynthesis|nr:glycosyltransferase family 2 protein [Acidimicrobiales bacterium]